ETTAGVENALRRQRREVAPGRGRASIGEPAGYVRHQVGDALKIEEADLAAASERNDHPVGHRLAWDEVQVGRIRPWGAARVRRKKAGRRRIRNRYVEGH